MHYALGAGAVTTTSAAAAPASATSAAAATVSAAALSSRCMGVGLDRLLTSEAGFMVAGRGPASILSARLLLV